MNSILFTHLPSSHVDYASASYLRRAKVPEIYLNLLLFLHISVTRVLPGMVPEQYYLRSFFVSFAHSIGHLALPLLQRHVIVVVAVVAVADVFVVDVIASSYLDVFLQSRVTFTVICVLADRRKGWLGSLTPFHKRACDVR